MNESSNTKTEYIELLNLVNLLKDELGKQVSEIDEIYNIMLDNCSIDELPLDESLILENKRDIQDCIEKLSGCIKDQINEKLSEF